MIEATQHQQADIKEAHRERSEPLEGEPLYGLNPIAGHGGEAPIEESVEDEAEEEPGRAGATEPSTNLVWGIILGGALLLFVVAAILIWGVGVSYSAAIITQYPVK